METTVPYRRREEFMSESGARVEVWSKCGEVTMEVGEDYDPKSNEEDLSSEKLFYGVMMVMTGQGPKEIKFFIPDVTELKDAMKAYPAAVTEVVAQLEHQRVEAMKQQESKIVQAPAAILDELNDASRKPKIHVP